MPLGLESIVLRIMRLEKIVRRLRAAIDEAEDKADRDRGNRDRPSRIGEIVIVRPLEAIGTASFTEAVTGPPYQAARLVPATGDCIVWQDYPAGSPGEMRALRYVRRWDPEAEPPAYVDEDAIVEVDNFNRRESIPSAADYIVCVRRPDGRLKALVWDCGP